MMLGKQVSTYFTDREYGARPPTLDVIDERLWAGLYSLIHTGIGNGSFGLRFPEQCPDGNGPCGCDEQALRRGSVNRMAALPEQRARYVGDPRSARVLRQHGG